MLAYSFLTVFLEQGTAYPAGGGRAAGVLCGASRVVIPGAGAPVSAAALTHAHALSVLFAAQKCWVVCGCMMISLPSNLFLPLRTCMTP